MNEPLTLEPWMLDALVEGDLDESLRPGVLAALDRTPDGWKRLAGRFLEAQTLREVCRDLLRPEIARASASAESSAPRLRTLSGPEPRERRHPALPLLALTLTLLAGIGVGRILLHAAPSARPLDSVAAGSAVESGRSASTPTGDGPGEAHPEPDMVRLVGDVAWREAEALALKDLPSARLTVFEGKGIDEAWVRRQPPALAESVVQRLGRQGLKVDQRRRIVPVELADGTRLAVRLDQFEVRIVGRPANL